MDDKYLHYELEDFIIDEGFVNAIKDQSLQGEWSAWIKDHPEVAPKIAEAKLLVASLKFKQEAFDNKGKVWSRIDQSTQAKEIPLPSKRGSIRLIWGAIAASAACIALFFYLNGSQSGPMATQNMSLSALQVTLPSGSVVDLQPGAKIDYDESLWDAERKIELSGTATFDVTKGRPFVVTTTNGSVRVLGTQFTVNSHDNTFLVDVKEGRVEVTSDTQKEVLTAGMAFNKNPSYQDIQTTKSNLTPDKVNIYQFDKTKLENVLMTIENEFDVKLVASDAIKEKMYTGFFKSDDLESALYNVFWPLDIEYTISEKTIILSQD